MGACVHGLCARNASRSAGYVCARSGSVHDGKGICRGQASDTRVASVSKKSARFENSRKDDDWTAVERQRVGGRFFMPPDAGRSRDGCRRGPLRNQLFHNFVNATCAAPTRRAYELNDAPFRESAVTRFRKLYITRLGVLQRDISSLRKNSN